MNPIQIGSAAITSFGFTSTFDLLANTLKFDISALTEFMAGGQSAVKGIAFAVKDPSGLDLCVIDFTTPQINPVNTSVFTLNMVSGFAKFGWYTIRGSIKDQDNSIYSIDLKKEICQPENFDNGYVPGKFAMDIDCDVPQLTIREISKIIYKGLLPDSVTRTGTFSYPPGTIANLAITAVPFMISGSGHVYTGRYTINNTSVGKFNLQDSVYVLVSYKTIAFEKVVNCQTALVTVLCCIENCYDQYKASPYSSNGKFHKQKLDEISIPLSIAIVKEKAGIDAGDQVTEIAKILNCDCNCAETSVPVTTL